MTTTTTKVENLKLSQQVITSINYDLGSELLGFIGTISLLRPDNGYSATTMNLNIDIYNDLKCEKCINTKPISNKNISDRKYFQVFQTDGESRHKWINGTDSSLDKGFGEEYAKRPIVFLLGQWLKDNGKAGFTASTKYYIIYTWETSDGSKSDVNSIMWPNFENY